MQPTGMDWRMDPNRVAIGREQPTNRGVTAMRRAIIDDPKHALGRPIGLLRPDLRHQAAQGFNPRLRFASSSHSASLDLPGRQILQRPTAGILVLDTPLAPRCWTQTRMTTQTGWN